MYATIFDVLNDIINELSRLQLLIIYHHCYKYYKKKSEKNLKSLGLRCMLSTRAGERLRRRLTFFKKRSMIKRNSLWLFLIRREAQTRMGQDSWTHWKPNGLLIVSMLGRYYLGQSLLDVPAPLPQFVHDEAGVSFWLTPLRWKVRPNFCCET